MKKRKIMILLLSLSIALSLVLVGCGEKAKTTYSEQEKKETTTTQETTTVASEVGTEEETDLAEKGSDSKKVGILLKTLSNPFWVDMAEGIQAEADAKGIEVDILAMDSEDEVEGQLKKMEDMINSNEYDGIGIAPITGTNLISGVVAANEKNMPVVNIDAKLDEDALEEAGGYVIGFATTDNKKLGQIGAQYIMDQLPDGGEIAIIEGRAGDLSGELRRDGCKEELEANEGYNVVDVQPADWDRQKALDVATNIMTKNPDLKAFFVANDTMALGVLQAIQNTNNEGKIILVGTDASDETYTAIDAGRMVAVIQSPADIGKTCFNILLDHIEKGETGSLDYKPVEELISAELVTQ